MCRVSVKMVIPLCKCQRSLILYLKIEPPPIIRRMIHNIRMFSPVPEIFTSSPINLRLKVLKVEILPCCYRGIFLSILRIYFTLVKTVISPVCHPWVIYDQFTLKFRLWIMDIWRLSNLGWTVWETCLFFKNKKKIQPHVKVLFYLLHRGLLWSKHRE